MNFIKRNWQTILLVFIGLIIIITRFVPISFGDLYDDNAINSFRAYGWFDYLGTSGQSAPFEWLGYVPTWGNLSFHDAPPLAFFIQHIFFVFFGGNVVVARLPFVLAGVASIFLVYFLLKKITNQRIATWAAIIYSVLSYSVWASQAAYLEGIEEFFIVASVLFGAFYLLNDQKKKFLFLWVIFTACALLTKYTALFLLPSIVLYAFLYRKTLKLQWKSVLLAVIIFFILLSPVIIYNINVYQLRGHFDAALSSIVGMHPEDYWIISSRSASPDIFPNIWSEFNILKSNMSFPLLVLFFVCLLVLISQIRKKGWRSIESIVLVNFFFLVLMFGFSGPTTRFLSILVPFIVLITALAIPIIFSWLKNKPSLYLTSSVLAVIILFEGFYSFNTNVLKNPIGKADWLYSVNKVQNLGFNQLDNFIRNNVIVSLPPKVGIEIKNDISFTNKDFVNRSVIIIDDRINWFAQMWYFQRYFLFHRWPYFSTSYLSDKNPNRLTIPDLLNASGKPLYFIYPIDQSVIDPTRDADESLNATGPALATSLDKSSTEVIIIKNSIGIPVFKIYRIDRI